MIDCIDTKIENALKDKNITKIMNKASYTFKNQLDPDVIYTCQINALWKAFKNFKPEKSTKFTTYLYNGVYIECIKEIKFLNKFNRLSGRKLHDNITKNDENFLLTQIMDELKDEEEREIIKDKISKMTINEMSKKRNINRETMRKKLKSIVKRLEKKFF